MSNETRKNEPAPRKVFSLESFEQAVYSRNHEKATRKLLSLFDLLNQNYGGLRQNFSAHLTRFADKLDADQHIATRISAAITTLFSDPNFMLSQLGYQKIISLQRWMGTLFAATAFRNTDHIIRMMNLEGAASQDVKLDDKSVLKFCLLYSPESDIPIDLDGLWKYNKVLTACLALVLMSPRFLGTPAAHRKREALLEWLPSRLGEIEDLNFLPNGILHDVYMQCSYADSPRRHDIKVPINQLLRKKLKELKIDNLDVMGVPRRRINGKPVMIVVLEWFTAVHSIYRTHSLSMEACRRHFHLIGIGESHTVDDTGKKVFDEFIVVPSGSPIKATKKIQEIANEYLPSVLYMPSVGMFPLTMCITNLRLAPLQMAALGHPATTRSDYVDYIVVEDDYVGDPACFSEQLFRLPRNGMPYRPSAAYEATEPRLRDRPDTVAIAIASSVMKLNPGFLAACKSIAERAKTPLQFHFLLGFGQGFVFIAARNLILSYLPDAVVYPHQGYKQYMGVIGRCDMYINPFPFGNTNGVVDMTHHGLVGICKSGPEVFEQIDAAMFRRMDLPESLIAPTVEDYVSAAVELADNHEARIALRQRLLGTNALERIFQGDPDYFGNTLIQMVEREKICP
jgi:hypothetical protein